VAWEDACRPKVEGGLNIMDLRTQNDALLLKYLDKFFNCSNVPWVSLTWSKLYANNRTPPQARRPVGSFWWRDVMKLFENF
jgi:hypothetical protein